jgi:hypothetical protein
VSLHISPKPGRLQQNKFLLAVAKLTLKRNIFVLKAICSILPRLLFGSQIYLAKREPKYYLSISSFSKGTLTKWLAVSALLFSIRFTSLAHRTKSK